MDDKEYVKNFSKITVSKICKDNKISKANISSGKASKEKYSKVRKLIENEIAKLYLIEGNKDE